jgi:hypothetical protein
MCAGLVNAGELSVLRVLTTAPERAPLLFGAISGKIEQNDLKEMRENSTHFG